MCYRLFDLISPLFIVSSIPSMDEGPPLSPGEILKSLEANPARSENVPQNYLQPPEEAEQSNGSHNLTAEDHQLSKILTELKKMNRTSDFFYKNIQTVAVLGASITFTILAVQIQDPRSASPHGKFDLSTVRILLAVAWLLFMVSLNASFTFQQPTPSMGSFSAGIASEVAYLLIVAPVLCTALVVSAYVEVVGYIGVGLTSWVAIGLILRLTLRCWLRFRFGS